MQIGLGLDSRLGLTTAQLADLASEAKPLGYESLWTNAGVDYDPIAMCIAKVTAVTTRLHWATSLIK